MFSRLKFCNFEWVSIIVDFYLFDRYSHLEWIFCQLELVQIQPLQRYQELQWFVDLTFDILSWKSIAVVSINYYVCRM